MAGSARDSVSASGRMDLTCLRDLPSSVDVMVEVSYESTSAGRQEDLHLNVMLAGGTEHLDKKR